MYKLLPRLLPGLPHWAGNSQQAPDGRSSSSHSHPVSQAAKDGSILSVGQQFLTWTPSVCLRGHGWDCPDVVLGAVVGCVSDVSGHAGHAVFNQHLPSKASGKCLGTGINDSYSIFLGVQ